MPAQPWVLLALFATCALAASALTWLVLRLLRRHAILDHPNARSSHDRPVPRGGGWGVMLAVLPAWALLALVAGEDRFIPLMAGAVLLMAVSWRDDLVHLPAAFRLASHAIAVCFGLYALPGDAAVFQGLLPIWADRLVAGLCWVWFINLFNFMDGIDGLSGVEATSIALGVVAVAAVAGAGDRVAAPAVALAGAVLGFIIWNWHPARIFLGDVGSVPMGYLTGWLLLTLAAAGAWAAALLLPAYYLADATLTLARRLLRGAKVWEAHREHAYQRAVQAGRSHASVSLLVLAVNVVLLALAVAATLLGSGAAAFIVLVGAAVALGFLKLLSVQAVTGA